MESLDFQQIINKIDGIINSKVVIDKNNIVEIHILASNYRSPKQIVRDIESILLTSFDYRIDRKKVSIAQIQTDEQDTLRRVRFTGVTVNSFGNTVECSVKLTYQDEEYSVSQTGINTSTNRRRIVADSTIKAVESILGQAYMFDIQDVIVTTNNDTTFVSVLVNVVANGKEEVMVGSAVIKNDINETIAKSALDAINRRVQKINI
jgi:hypothetical protein